MNTITATTSFSDLYTAVAVKPTARISKTVVQEIVSNHEFTTQERDALIASRRVHKTVMFAEVLRNAVFTLNELLSITSTSPTGQLAVLKNVGAYSEKIDGPDGFEFLRALITPRRRASNSVSDARTQKGVVSALCTRDGFFAVARELAPELRAQYEDAYGENLETTAVKYIISVYAQELELTANDRDLILPRVANALRKSAGGEKSAAAVQLEFYIRNRFYYRMFDDTVPVNAESAVE